MSYDAIWYRPYDGLCHMHHLQASQTSLRSTYQQQHHPGFPEPKVCVATVLCVHTFRCFKYTDPQTRLEHLLCMNSVSLNWIVIQVRSLVWMGGFLCIQKEGETWFNLLIKMAEVIAN